MKVKVSKLKAFQIATAVLALALVAVVVLNGGITGAVIGGNSADDTLSFINQNLLQPGTEATLVNKTREGGVNVLTLDLNGEQATVYTSGDYLFLTGINMAEMEEQLANQPAQQPTQQAAQESQEVPKTDKPKVELHIFSYCPAGSAALDSFSETADFMKSQADFEVHFFSNMHGEYEKQQNLVQLCIQKEEPNKYWDYAKAFKETVYTACARSSDNLNCDKEESIKLMTELGIDSDNIFDCVETDGATMYAEDKQRATELGLRYSPSLVINDVDAHMEEMSSRSAESIKDVVCSAFNDIPDVCSMELSTQSASSGAC